MGEFDAPENHVVARVVLRIVCMTGGEGGLNEALQYFILLSHYLSF